MQKTETHIIKENHPNYAIFHELSKKTKNLYNAGLYSIKQHYKETGKFKSWHDVRKEFVANDNVDYRALPGKVAKDVIRGLGQDMSSLFGLLKLKKQGLYDKDVKMPYYKDKNGKHIIEFEKQTISKNVNQLSSGMYEYTLCIRELNIKILSKYPEIDCVRIKPKHRSFEIQIIYTVDIPKLKEIKKKNMRIAAIDPGVRNLITMVFNTGDNPIYVSGGLTKSINQYYNKEKARLQSLLPKKQKTSNRIKVLTNKRNEKLKWVFHNTSKSIVNFLVENNIDTLIIGKSNGWKDETNQGRQNNQNFVNIPHNKLIQQLQYKSKEVGINVIMQEESYTSQANFLNGDYIPTYGVDDHRKNEFTGKRNKGLYETNLNRVINSDVNGAYNILKKAFPKAFRGYGIEALPGTPSLLKAM